MSLDFEEDVHPGTQQGASAAAQREQLEILEDVERAERQLAAGQGVDHETARKFVLERVGG